uniref:Uncharacterized protein n=1 Tax=Cannabis sativa TaxID=3483 RepID=A0A803PG99_CANSA
MVIALLAIIEIGTTRARDLPTNNNGGTLTDQKTFGPFAPGGSGGLPSFGMPIGGGSGLPSFGGSGGGLPGFGGLGGSTGGNNFFGPPSTTSP